MTSITKAQLTTIHMLLQERDLIDDKKQIVKEYSNGRTESSRELTKYEALELIKSLKGENKIDRAGDAMRKKIISMAHEMGWKQKDGRIDMARLNTWMLKSSLHHKKMDSYEYNELPALVSQFEKVYLSFIKGL